MKFNLSVLLLAALASAKRDNDHDNNHRNGHVDRVIFLGLDGAGNFNTKLAVPAINNLLESGAYTNYASSVDPSWSAHNWASIFHGVTPDKHGIGNDNIKTQAYPEDSQYPSIFKIINQQDPKAKLASFAQWNPINTGLIERSLPVYRFNKRSDDEIFPEFINFLKTNGTSTKFISWVIGDIDDVGHAKCWMCSEFVDEFITTDGYIAQILNTLDSLKIRESTLIVIAADHGGVKYSHGGATPKEKDVLFGIIGKDIRRKKLEDHTVKNMDAAAVILESLGYKVPANFDAKYPTLR